MKHEYKKQEKELYAVATKPSLITVPTQKFIMIDGKGDPNGEDFSKRVSVLFPLAYATKMQHKSFCNNNPGEAAIFPYQDYAVYPLEGLWTSETSDTTDKSKFIYTIMIRQPDFITQEMYEEALTTVRKKKPHPLQSELRFGEIEDGLCVQMLHNGAFDDEPASFALMDIFAAENGYKRASHVHREIYLNDARKTELAKRKTILRYRVQGEV